MKKALLIISILGLISLASCKKEYTCKCTTSYTGTNSENIESFSSVTISETKCADLESTATSDGITMNTTCTEQ